MTTEAVFAHADLAYLFRDVPLAADDHVDQVDDLLSDGVVRWLLLRNRAAIDHWLREQSLCRLLDHFLLAGSGGGLGADVASLLCTILDDPQYARRSTVFCWVCEQVESALTPHLIAADGQSARQQC